MLEAAEAAMGFVAERRRADLDADRMLVLAVLKAIEIVGEAATRVSPEEQERHTEIPWPAIVGMRNRLIHGYFDVNLDVVWRTVQEELPE